MNKTIKGIVNSVLSIRAEKPMEYEFKLKNKTFVLYPDGTVWLRKKGEDLKKKFINKNGIWLTMQGRSALRLRDISTELTQRLELMAPKKKGLKVKLPKGAKPMTLKKKKKSLEPENPPEKVDTRKLDDSQYSQDQIYNYIKTLSKDQIVKLMDMAANKYYNY